MTTDVVWGRCMVKACKPSSSAFTHVADVPSRRRLRSASTNQLLVPSYRRSTIGRCPSLDGAWRQNFFVAATMLADCSLLLQWSLKWTFYLGHSKYFAWLINWNVSSSLLWTILFLFILFFNTGQNSKKLAPGKVSQYWDNETKCNVKKWLWRNRHILSNRWNYDSVRHGA